MIDSEAVGRNIHKEIVMGIKATIIIKYPKFNKFDIDKHTKPSIIEIRHN